MRRERSGLPGGYGATAARLTPGQKGGSSNLSGLKVCSDHVAHRELCRLGAKHFVHSGSAAVSTWAALSKGREIDPNLPHIIAAREGSALEMVEPSQTCHWVLLGMLRKFKTMWWWWLSVPV